MYISTMDRVAEIIQRTTGCSPYDPGKILLNKTVNWRH